MDYFITSREGGTLYGCYHQALRELHNLVGAACAALESLELLAVDIRELENRESPRCQILAKHKRRRAERIRHEYETCTRGELRRFYGQVLAIRNALSEQGVTFPIDSETMDRLDREMWVHTLLCELTFQMNSPQGGPQAHTLKLIQALPDDMRKEVLSHIMRTDSAAHLLNWAMSYQCQLPEPVDIPDEQFDAIALVNQYRCLDVDPAIYSGHR